MRMTRDSVLDALNYINTCPDKPEIKSTTSRSLKIDLLKWADAQGLSSSVCIEMGIAHGYTTTLLAKIFSRVLAVDNNPENLDHVRERKISNVDVVGRDLYATDFVQSMSSFGNVDVAFIDAQHTEIAAITDFRNAFDMGARIFIFDDFGLDPAVHLGVTKIIQEHPSCRIHFLGLQPGTEIPITYHKVMRDWEGIILDLR